jgi:serine/threonine-protein kinase
MFRCGLCHADVPDGRFCSRCGAPLDRADRDPAAEGTVTQTRTFRQEEDGDDHAGKDAARRASAGRTSGSSDQGRFLPGTILAGRYRIFGLVGRGGMGEVYRADDLKLGQAVALKFLPAGVEADQARLGRFLDEVRLARQIAHPSVCRVYDVGDVDGHPFLSMEYVDGEDLQSLLRRIGRLPKDKAAQIARQMCAGLAAAHEQGILHRDLKPSNVMLDGRGRARLTDFGLARLAGEVQGADRLAGTPAFMAPEQMAGEAPTVRSDLYSLGLVLYEMCTGKPAFTAPTPADLTRRKLETTPTAPSQVVEEIDPAMERIILRCLDPDPAKRPASALAVAASLPGGDPLAAALAAGETPSPELVAQAEAAGGLRPAVAWACLGAVALGVIAVTWMSLRVQYSSLVPLPKAPEVLAERARDILRGIGYADPPADSTRGFELEREYLDALGRDTGTRLDWMRLSKGPPYAVTFWYRQSPYPLVPWDDLNGVPPGFNDPPAVRTGMTRIRLDPEGRLLMLEVVPPERESAVAAAPDAGARDADWNGVLAFAGLDLMTLRPVAPAWTPKTYADRRSAWEGAWPEAPGVPLRIEAASYRGRPVAFRVLFPWSRARGMEAPFTGGGVQVFISAILLLIMGGGLFLARRNLRLGRGDRRGALRLAGYFFLTFFVGWAFDAHHVAPVSEFGGFLINLAATLLAAAMTWVLYLAIEPFMRRFWPRTMVSWARLLDGRFRDPLVGRHVLLGVLAGLGLMLVWGAFVAPPAALGLRPLRPDEVGPGAEPLLISLISVRHAVGQLIVGLGFTLIIPLGLVTLLLMCRLVLRRSGLAIAAFVVLTALSGLGSSTNPPLDVAFRLAFDVIFLLVLFRGGLLMLVLIYVTGAALNNLPLTFDTTAWYASQTFVLLLFIGGLTLYGFRTAVAGRSAPARP